MLRNNGKCERLELILKGITSAVLELDLSEGDINLIKDDLRELGYGVSYEIKDEQQKLYHLHIIKSSAYKNA